MDLLMGARKCDTALSSTLDSNRTCSSSTTTSSRIPSYRSFGGESFSSTTAVLDVRRPPSTGRPPSSASSTRTNNLYDEGSWVEPMGPHPGMDDAMLARAPSRAGLEMDAASLTMRPDSRAKFNFEYRQNGRLSPMNGQSRSRPNSSGLAAAVAMEQQMRERAETDSRAMSKKLQAADHAQQKMAKQLRKAKAAVDRLTSEQQRLQQEVKDGKLAAKKAVNGKLHAQNVTDAVSKGNCTPRLQEMVRVFTVSKQSGGARSVKRESVRGEQSFSTEAGTPQAATPGSRKRGNGNTGLSKRGSDTTTTEQEKEREERWQADQKHILAITTALNAASEEKVVLEARMESVSNELLELRETQGAAEEKHSLRNTRMSRFLLQTRVVLGMTEAFRVWKCYANMNGRLVKAGMRWQDNNDHQTLKRVFAIWCDVVSASKSEAHSKTETSEALEALCVLKEELAAKAVSMDNLKERCGALSDELDKSKEHVSELQGKVGQLTELQASLTSMTKERDSAIHELSTCKHSHEKQIALLEDQVEKSEKALRLAEGEHAAAALRLRTHAEGHRESSSQCTTADIHTPEDISNLVTAYDNAVKTIIRMIKAASGETVPMDAASLLKEVDFIATGDDNSQSKFAISIESWTSITALCRAVQQCEAQVTQRETRAQDEHKHLSKQVDGLRLELLSSQERVKEAHERWTEAQHRREEDSRCSQATIAEMQQHLNNNSQQLVKYEAAIKGAEATIATITSESDSQRNELIQASARCVTLSAETDRLNKALSSSNARIESLERLGEQERKASRERLSRAESQADAARRDAEIALESMSQERDELYQQQQASIARAAEAAGQIKRESIAAVTESATTLSVAEAGRDAALQKARGLEAKMARASEQLATLERRLEMADERQVANQAKLDSQAKDLGATSELANLAQGQVLQLRATNAELQGRISVLSTKLSEVSASESDAMRKATELQATLAAQELVAEESRASAHATATELAERVRTLEAAAVAHEDTIARASFKWTTPHRSSKRNRSSQLFMKDEGLVYVVGDMPITESELLGGACHLASLLSIEKASHREKQEATERKYAAQERIQQHKVDEADRQVQQSKKLLETTTNRADTVSTIVSRLIDALATNRRKQLLTEALLHWKRIVDQGEVLAQAWNRMRVIMRRRGLRREVVKCLQVAHVHRMQGVVAAERLNRLASPRRSRYGSGAARQAMDHDPMVFGPVPKKDDIAVLSGSSSAPPPMSISESVDVSAALAAARKARSTGETTSVDNKPNAGVRSRARHTAGGAVNGGNKAKTISHRASANNSSTVVPANATASTPQRREVTSDSNSVTPVASRRGSRASLREKLDMYLSPAPSAAAAKAKLAIERKPSIRRKNGATVTTPTAKGAVNSLENIPPEANATTEVKSTTGSNVPLVDSSFDSIKGKGDGQGESSYSANASRATTAPDGRDVVGTFVSSQIEKARGIDSGSPSTSLL